MKKPSVLFVCTGNCCRSQMADAICRHLAGERLEVLSCGSMPAGFVHPLALTILDEMRIPTGNLESKSCDEFLETPIDVAITLCDSAAAVCPNFPGNGLRVHWPLPDPSFHEGTTEQRLAFCQRVAERIRLKIEGLMKLDLENGPRAELQQGLEALADL